MNINVKPLPNGRDAYFVTGVYVDTGINPSLNQLYAEMIKTTREIVEQALVGDTLKVCYSHQWSHISGRKVEDFDLVKLAEFL